VIAELVGERPSLLLEYVRDHDVRALGDEAARVAGAYSMGTARDNHCPIIETFHVRLGLHNCDSLSLVVVFISLFASELRVLESPPWVTDRNLERIASLLAVQRFWRGDFRQRSTAASE